MPAKLLFVICLFFALCLSASATELSFAELEQAGTTIGSITIKRNNVFEPEELSSRKKGKRLRRWANRLHRVTNENVIRSQLLLKPGDRLTTAAVAESERILRANRYLYTATIVPSNYENGVIDLTVTTRDLWTLTPEIDYSKTGGDTFYTIGIEDDNLLGTGASLTISRSEELERTSDLLLYSNRNFLLRRLDFGLGIVNSDDGGAFSARLNKPFFSLDSLTAAGSSINYFDGSRSYFRNGDTIGEFDQIARSFNFFKGWSSGRQNNWVRRWTTGLAGENSTFSPPDNPASFIVSPTDRELYYPFVTYNVFEDKFVTAQNFRTIDRVEDVYLGTQYSVLLGLASKELGSDRNALILGASAGQSLGSPDNSLIQMSLRFNSRLESGRPQNFIANADVSWTVRQSDKFRFFTSLNVSHSERADLDRFTVLGGSSGLRGYPTRFRNGGGRVLFTAEERYYSNYYPFKLFKVGAAMFLDVGQVWGENVLGEKNNELLVDTGFGLRLASPRAGSKKVIHIDLAFPLTNRDGIDNVQLVVQTKRRF